jgi:hypothetical protein
MKPVASLTPDHAPPDPVSAEILTYLKNRIPSYPFSDKIDNDFVDELVLDFGHLDILEEIKAFRWYYDNQPVAKVKNVRLSLRRWLGNARDQNRY